MLPATYAATSPSRFLNHVASIVPEMECHAQLNAHGMTANGQVATKKVDASTVASPAFCIPTSIEIVRFFAFEKRNSRPTV